MAVSRRLGILYPPTRVSLGTVQLRCAPLPGHRGWDLQRTAQAPPRSKPLTVFLLEAPHEGEPGTPRTCHPIRATRATPQSRPHSLRCRHRDRVLPRAIAAGAAFRRSTGGFGPPLRYSCQH